MAQVVSTGLWKMKLLVPHRQCSYPPLVLNIENVTTASSKNCGHGRNERISLHDEDEDDDIGKKMYKDLMDEIAKDCPPLSEPENVAYSLLHLGQMKILMRSKIDAVYGCDRDDDEIDSQIETNKCPNTPYQLKYGFEVNTPSELMKQWVLLHTHPGSLVVKARINAVKLAVAMWEEVSLPNLPRDKDFDPRPAVCQLHTILDTLKSLPEGQYLLVHRKGEQTLTLKKAVKRAKRGAFDLHSAIKQRLEEIDNFNDIDTSRNEVPWLPIDSSIALPEHKRD